MPTLKLKVGKYLFPVQIEQEGKNRLALKFRYNKKLLEEIKNMEGAKWHGFDDPPRKIWTIKDSPRNSFQLRFLCGENPYEYYDRSLPEPPDFDRPLYEHQKSMVAHGLFRKRCIFACEMGTGKTLSAIEIIERSGTSEWIWIGPKSALAAVNLEFLKWDFKSIPTMYTYEKFKKDLHLYLDSPPKGIILDESSKVKTPTAQRSQAIREIADRMREVWGDDCYIILMSGAPAPKAPTDWWNQCEIVCPGFLKEGSVARFKHRLALIEQREGDYGSYPQLITWFDDKDKCKKCGLYTDAHSFETDHVFKSSINEVSYLYKRMRGLVLVQLKKDCLDLPEIQYRLIQCEPSKSILRTAQLISKTAPRAITGLMRLRELSDGFQYTKKPISTEVCPICHGNKEIEEWYDPKNPNEPISEKALIEGNLEKRFNTCDTCDSTGKVKKYERATVEIECPKDKVLIDLLDQHNEIGRFVLYGGFTGTIDRCLKICLKEGWSVIRVDGRGWLWSGVKAQKVVFDEPSTPVEMLQAFQDKDKVWPNIVFLGQPGAAGMGLNLTASPTILFFSNDFNFDSRIQAVHRIHRMGMDVNRGATIVDIIHLETDLLVLNNLNKKNNLQNLSLGNLREAFKDADSRVTR